MRPGDAPSSRPPRAELRGLGGWLAQTGMGEGARGKSVSGACSNAPRMGGHDTEGSQRSKNGLPPKTGRGRPGGVQLFVTLWAAACQASLSFTISQSLLKLMFEQLSW